LKTILDTGTGRTHGESAIFFCPQAASSLLVHLAFTPLPTGCGGLLRETNDR
jgi:hypothetical protein